MNNSVLDRIYRCGIIPVVKIENADDAVDLSKALISGGINCAEITFRTAAGAKAIQNIREKIPDMLVGAGTVLNCEQAKKAVLSGAQFVVSPGLNREVVSYCIENNIPVVPGCATPSDIESALSLGLSTVKFFPAEAAGGTAMIKAMSAPYSGIRFMPTGGINEKNLNDYLSINNVIACGGSWMVKASLINEHRFSEITEMTRIAVSNMLGFTLKHIGINPDENDNANDICNRFQTLLSFGVNDIGKGLFVGDIIEVMKQKGRGGKGHIAVGVNNIDRAIDFLKRQGLAFDESSAVYNKDGRCTFIYLSEEIGGFAVHLCNN